MTPSPTRVVFGAGAAHRLPALLHRDGVRSCLLVTGASGATARLADAIAAELTTGRGRHGVRVVRGVEVRPDPPVEDLAAGLDRLRAAGVDAVVAVGGGSVLDYAKLLAAVAAQGWADPRACLTGPLRAARRHRLVLVPTTAGTGSEVTGIAVLTVDGRKRSLHADALRADLAVVDPDLTGLLPPAVTASTGVDALSQAVESYWSVHSTPRSRRYALAGLTLAATHLPGAVRDGDPVSRTAMMRAALLSGRAIDLTQTTAPHALSYLLTTRFGVPHGHACGVFLGPVLAYNAAVGDGDVADPRGVRYVRARVREVVRRLGARDPAAAAAGLDRLLTRAGLPVRLSALGVAGSDLADLVAAAAASPRLAANPRRLGPAELTALVRARW